MVLHMILLDQLILLVKKQDGELILKFHTSPVGVALSGARRDYWTPVLQLDSVHVKENATDPNAFFLVAFIPHTGMLALKLCVLF